MTRAAGTHSAAKIADRTGIGRTTVWRWQSTEPAVQHVIRFAEAYGEDLLVAFIGAGWIPPELPERWRSDALAGWSDRELLAELLTRSKPSKRVQLAKDVVGDAPAERSDDEENSKEEAG